MGWKSGWALSAVVLGGFAGAQAICHTDRDTWIQAVGAPTAGEDFEGFTFDWSFEYGPVPIGVGTITLASGPVTGSNYVDVFPFEQTPGQPPEHNGTDHAECRVDSLQALEIRIDFAPRVSAFAANLYGAVPFPGEGVSVDAIAGGAVLFTCPVPWSGGIFVGLESAIPIEAVVLRAQYSIPGTNGEPFALDEIEVVASACAAPPSTYCTAGTTSNGCVATISSSGWPSATATSGFTLSVTQVEGQRSGVVFYGTGGPAAYPWWQSNPSYLCVQPPVQRTPLQGSAGSAGGCDGALALDWNAFRASTPGALGAPFQAGDLVWAQGWFRDPGQPPGTCLSNAIVYSVCH